MKCSNCGKNEVSFYYTSNINGQVTKTALCAECAEKLGYTDNIGNMFARSERMMSDMMDGFFGRSLSPFRSMSLFAPEIFGLPGYEQRQEKAGQNETGSCSCGKNCECEAPEQNSPAVDSELSKRREINALRHQMHLAARREDYEKAAELRDRISKLEG